jgi:hypothetical protein
MCLLFLSRDFKILRSATARVSRWDHPRQVPSALRMARYAAAASYPAAPATHDRVIEVPWVPQALVVAGEQRAQRFNRNCFAHRRSPPPPHRSVQAPRCDTRRHTMSQQQHACNTRTHKFRAGRGRLAAVCVHHCAPHLPGRFPPGRCRPAAAAVSCAASLPSASARRRCESSARPRSRAAAASAAARACSATLAA